MGPKVIMIMKMVSDVTFLLASLQSYSFLILLFKLTTRSH
jgi:hypothetical protein